MSYTLDTSISLSSCQTGLTLNAILLSSTGAELTESISSGFTEIGGGHYLWHYELFPDGFREAVKFFEQGASSTILAVVAINPQEGENIDQKVSTIDESRIMSVNELKNTLLSNP